MRQPKRKAAAQPLKPSARPPSVLRPSPEQQQRQAGIISPFYAEGQDAPPSMTFHYEKVSEVGAKATEWAPFKGGAPQSAFAAVGSALLSGMSNLSQKAVILAVSKFSNRGSCSDEEKGGVNRKVDKHGKTVHHVHHEPAR